MSNEPPEKSSQPPQPPVYTSQELLGGASEFWIEHGEDLYRVRLTASGKLLLTK